MTNRSYRTRRLLFRQFLWVCSLGFVLLVLGLGTHGFMGLGADLPDAAYRAIQLFGLNFDVGDPPPEELPLALEVARFLAPGVLIAAVVKLLADGFWMHLRRIWHTRKSRTPRDVVIGFGPLGREVGRRLLEDGSSVTWIDRIGGDNEALRDAREAAERMGGVLLTGDPADPRQLEAARIDRAQRAFVALGDDLASFGTAEAIRAHAPGLKDIRVFTESPSVAGFLPLVAGAGFMTGRGVELFNIRGEAVRNLVRTAQWDRLAGLVGQDRVHLVIAGFGWQGEALMEETLLLCNRVGLKPPLVTVIDRNADAARDRVRRRSPALLSDDLGVEDWLPPRFIRADLETVDFSALNLCESEAQHPVPVTAWVVCTGDDDLNLRTALQLQMAIQSRGLDGSSIHVRIWAGHAGMSYKLGTDGLGMSIPFGGLDAGLDQTAALAIDPDKDAKILHMAYLATEPDAPGLRTVETKEPDEVVPMARSEGSKAYADEEWVKLSPTKMTANRRAHRHAAMKFFDLGYDWRGWLAGRLPGLSDEQWRRWADAHKALAKAGFSDEMHDDATTRLGENEATFLGVMTREHRRWTIDRAIDGWQRADIRDESRLLHPYMDVWSNLDCTTRAYDAVQVRAFIERPKDSGMPAAWAHTSIGIDLRDATAVLSTTAVAEWLAATEAQIVLPTGNLERPEKTTFTLEAEHLHLALGDRLKELARGGILCRIFLVFPAPPAKPVLDLANYLAGKVSQKGVAVAAVWAWKKGADTTPRLPAWASKQTKDVTVEVRVAPPSFAPYRQPSDSEIWANMFRQRNARRR
jgi:hypothetical protein